MIKSRNLNGDIVYDILTFEEEEDLQTIYDLIAKQYTVSITEVLEGPGTTIWYIKINGNSFALINNTWGNFLRTLDNDAKVFMEQEKVKINKLW